jgi:hypothetical protein
MHEGFDGEPSAGDSARFSVRNRYVAPDGSVICRERAAYSITPNADGYLLTIDTQFSSDQAFTFGVKEEMGLALRVATPIRVKDGNGSILSARGGRDEEGTWGLVDRWWDYAGVKDGRRVGVLLMSGIDNPDVWAHSRDYGLLVANPFPLDREGNRDKKTRVEPGNPFRLRFGVQVHEHAKAAPFDPQAAYLRYHERLKDES